VTFSFIDNVTVLRQHITIVYVDPSDNEQPRDSQCIHMELTAWCTVLHQKSLS